MFKRLNVYFKEMYPIVPRLFLALVIFLEIYFIILLNQGITAFHLSLQEIIGSFTVFAFLMWLRIADDLKDYETDRRLFKERALPSGRVYKKDLITICLLVQLIFFILNLLFMNNLLFFFLLYGYGFLMSQWFFQKNKIQPSLPLALVTHNPVQLFINLYIVSFTCIKYQLSFFDLTTILTLWTLYFPALIWEVARKIRAPQDENDYVTYSKLFGYKKAVNFILLLTWIDILTNFVLVYQLNKVSILVLFVLVSWMTGQFIKYKKDPSRFKVVAKVERYTYLQELTMLLTVVIYLMVGRI